MLNLYLFRHGQAGPRNEYDTLSTLGVEQARALGEYLAREGMQFDAVFAGGLNRQQQTAAQVEAAYARAGVPFPGVTIDPRWSEFNLYGVYQAIAPQIYRVDNEFRVNYDTMLEALKDPASDVHRRWHACDEQVMQAWLEATYPVDVETFAEFRARVENGLESNCRNGHTGNVAVFTSATPMGLSVAKATNISGFRLMRLVESLYNTAWTVFKVRDGEPYLFSFNNIPHLIESRLRTFR